MDKNSMHNSILDKVMAASHEENLANFNPSETVTRLFRDLGGREQDILRRRFGLVSGKRETLEEIGASYQITRERVRQVENAAVKNIKNRQDFAAVFKPVGAAVFSALEKYGGIMAEEHLLSELSGGGNNNIQCAHLLFFLEKLSPKRLIREHNKGFLPAWRIDFVNWDKAIATVAAASSILEGAAWPLAEDELFSRLREHQTYLAHKTHYGFSDESPHPIQAHIRLSRILKKNVFGEWGLRHWPSVSPKRMGDKIYLVLKKHGSPLHFRELTAKINQTKFDNRPAHAPTVHNELILDKRYVLVGRGIYALTEWGYAPGVVGDVVAAILKKAGRPASREEIVEEVLKQRLVKRGTIYLALSNQNRFKRDEQGNYHLTQSVITSPHPRINACPELVSGCGVRVNSARDPMGNQWGNQ